MTHSIRAASRQTSPDPDIHPTLPLPLRLRMHVTNKRRDALMRVRNPVLLMKNFLIQEVTNLLEAELEMLYKISSAEIWACPAPPPHPHPREPW